MVKLNMLTIDQNKPCFTVGYLYKSDICASTAYFYKPNNNRELPGIC